MGPTYPNSFYWLFPRWIRKINKSNRLRKQGMWRDRLLDCNSFELRLKVYVYMQHCAVDLGYIWGIIFLFFFFCSTATNCTSRLTSLLVLSSVSEVLRLSLLFIQESVCDWASRQIYRTVQWLHLYSVRYANGKLEKRSAFSYVFCFFLLQSCLKSLCVLVTGRTVRCDKHTDSCERTLLLCSYCGAAALCATPAFC